MGLAVTPTTRLGRWGRREASRLLRLPLRSWARGTRPISGRMIHTVGLTTRGAWPVTTRLRPFTILALASPTGDAAFVFPGVLASKRRDIWKTDDQLPIAIPMLLLLCFWELLFLTKLIRSGFFQLIRYGFLFLIISIRLKNDFFLFSQSIRLHSII